MIEVNWPACIFLGVFVLVFGLITLAPFVLSGRISEQEEREEARKLVPGTGPGEIERR